MQEEEEEEGKDGKGKKGRQTGRGREGAALVAQW